jgi:hypothetical protein
MPARATASHPGTVLALRGATVCAPVVEVDTCRDAMVVMVLHSSCGGPSLKENDRSSAGNHGTDAPGQRHPRKGDLPDSVNLAAPVCHSRENVSPAYADPEVSRMPFA